MTMMQTIASCFIQICGKVNPKQEMQGSPQNLAMAKKQKVWPIKGWPPSQLQTNPCHGGTVCTCGG